MIFIILPHQLFHKKYLPKNIKKIILWEHPQYFTKYNFNKKKTYSTSSINETLL